MSPQHQFIVTTHSPEVINAASPTTITLLQKHEAETVAEQLDIRKTQHMREVLSAIGARLSDVFGADQILWVEGATEEQCFPLIVEHLLNRRLMGTRLVGMLHTADLDGRDSKRAIGIYRSLSQGSSLVPPALGFIVDRELRSDSKQDDIRRMFDRAGSKIVFTGRRMYENYLLNPRAIASVIATIEGFRSEMVTAQEVEHWLEDIPGNTTYFANKAMAAMQDWRQEVDGAKVLDRLFSELSEGRVMYEKTAYGPLLTEWIVKNEPQDLEELAELLASLLPEA